MIADEFTNSSHYEVCRELSTSKPEFSADRTRREPFTRSTFDMPLEEICNAFKVLDQHLWHRREDTGITDEELTVLRTMYTKFKTVRDDDLAVRKRQDLILRCLHPDGCYFPYLKRDVKRRAYEITGTDPLDGVEGLRFGRPDEKMFELSEYLEAEVEKLIEARRRGNW